tara:strand:+ start:1048 stop:1941 length:894 start_codon:yes stop_codon:yes gene_type:complete
MDFLGIPFDVFVNYIFCHLTLVDFMRFLCTSKEIKGDYDRPELWRLCYLKKKQKTFREKELKKMRKVACIDFRVMDQKSPRRDHISCYRTDQRRCNLILKNDTDVSYDIIYMSLSYSSSLNPVKEHQSISPGKVRYIRSYVNHIFEFSHRPESKDDHEKAYKTTYLKIKKEEEREEPYVYQLRDGTKRDIMKPVIFHLKGETYDEDTKSLIGLVHPFYSLKNFQDFKKQHKKLYLPEMKKKDKENSEKKKNLHLQIIEKNNRLLAMRDKYQQEILELESVLAKSERETAPLDSYFER